MISKSLLFLMKVHKIRGVTCMIYTNEPLGDRNTGPLLSSETHHIL